MTPRQKNKVIFLICIMFVVIAVALYASRKFSREPQVANVPPVASSTNTIQPDVSSSIPAIIRGFADNFDRTETIKEAAQMSQSTDANWWVSSGGYFYIDNGIAETIHGELPANDERRVDYAVINPEETDGGYHPQNIFRLVLLSEWQNYEQQAYYKIDRYILSTSTNRQASNGILLFNRYQDSQNLYYTGLRVDGAAVIKKKINGNYYTMAEQPFVSGPEYDRTNNPDLLPDNTWIGLRSEVITNPNNTVDIKLFIDMGATGNWKLAAEATDDGKSYGGAPILAQGYAGIRTDFMDVDFKDYSIEEFK
jgi:hypothetical protein